MLIYTNNKLNKITCLRAYTHRQARTGIEVGLPKARQNFFHQKNYPQRVATDILRIFIDNKYKIVYSFI
jgi:hypothetical protein